jgi:hypothetical protein
MVNNEGGYHKVVSQNEKEFVYKKLNIFRTTVHRQEFISVVLTMH